MRFYLGCHEVIWLERVTVPLFVSRRRLAIRRSFPRARCDWSLDSGGFTELEKFGDWTVTAAEYAAEVRRYREEIGRMEWAASQDWMCEPHILARTGLTIAEHQRRTLENFRQLQQIAPEVPWMPALQGWRVDDYLRHWEQYERAGIDLFRLPAVGVGSICRRQHMGEAEQIVRALAPLRLHGYGFKLTGIERCGDALTSSDSLAWSLDARYNEPLPGCRHKNCASCLRWALRWRERVLRCIQTSQARSHQLALRL